MSISWCGFTIRDSRCAVVCKRIECGGAEATLCHSPRRPFPAGNPDGGIRWESGKCLRLLAGNSSASIRAASLLFQRRASLWSTYEATEKEEQEDVINSLMTTRRNHPSKCVHQSQNFCPIPVPKCLLAYNSWAMGSYSRNALMLLSISFVIINDSHLKCAPCHLPVCEWRMMDWN